VANRPHGAVRVDGRGPACGRSRRASGSLGQPNLINDPSAS
jgi:hypothetical protein